MQNIKIKLFVLITIVFFSSFSRAHALTVSPIRFEISGDPGQDLVQEVTLYNEQDESKTFYPHYMNFQAEGETGTPSFIEPKDGLGKWIAAPAGITLDKRESKKIKFVISIPSDALPGGYFAALLFGTIPPSENGGTVAIGSETGPLILLRVNGEVKEDASILEFATKEGKTSFTALPIEMYYRFQNSGNDRTKPVGNIVIKNILGIKARTLNANLAEGNVLPGQIRHFDVMWKKTNSPDSSDVKRSFFENVKYEWNNFALGYFTANLGLLYGSKGEQAAVAKTSFLVFPWHLILVIIFIALILYFLINKIARSYNRWVIIQAEEMLKEEEKKEHKR